MRVPRNSTDILAKHLTNACPAGVLDVIGIPGVDAIRALPTELDQVEIRQEFTDVVLELAAGDILHMEFQTTREPTLYRFLSYDGALAEKFRRKIRTIVLYTGDISFAPETLDIGSAQYHVENVFLNRLDGDAAIELVERHLSSHEWTDRDRIRLAFAFHMRFETMSRLEVFERVLELTGRIQNPFEQNYVTAIILGLSGRNLTPEQDRRLREAMRMTEVVKEIEQEALQRGRQEGEHLKAAQVAEKLFRKGASVSDVVDVTGLSEKEAEFIRSNLH